MQAYKRVGAPNLALWRQSLAKAEQALGPDHPRVWMHTREIYKKAGGGEVPGLNAGVHGQPREQMAKGIVVEREHEQTLRDLAAAASNAVSAQDYTTAINMAIDKAIASIASDHVLEISDYYDRLEKMEREAKAGRPDLSPAAIARSRRENPLYAAPGAPARAIKRVKGSLIHLGTKMRTINLVDEGSGMDGRVAAAPAYSIVYRKEHQVGYGFQPGWAVLDEEGFVVNGDVDSIEAGYEALIYATKAEAEQARTALLAGKISVYLPASERGLDGSIEALAAAADQDEKALLAGQDLWYPDEWRG